MNIVIAGDHAGYDLKVELAEALRRDGHEVRDLGAFNREPSDDYPDFAYTVAKAIASGSAERGILVCGSGVGACMVANKVSGVRAGTCHDTYSGRQGVEHDDMNVLCLGARVIKFDAALEVSRVFLAARFSGEQRHLRRLAKMREIERRHE
jgi:ribose 5-phosphate isomerase B